MEEREGKGAREQWRESDGPTPSTHDWKAFGGLLRVVSALLALLACAAYAGRLLERIQTLGDQIQGLTTAVNEVRVVAADVKALASTVAVIVDNQKAMVASDSETRRQLDELRAEVRAEEMRQRGYHQ